MIMNIYFVIIIIIMNLSRLNYKMIISGDQIKIYESLNSNRTHTRHNISKKSRSYIHERIII